MKNKILLLGILVMMFLAIPVIGKAETAIIKDIVIDTQETSVKISITSSQTLQIETFKNDESPANYIVLDFLGTVYTNMPSIIDVGQGAVEKVSLVRGAEKAITIKGEDYYSLDFLAINLTSTADYRISQSKSVIDLSIGAASDIKIAEAEVESEMVSSSYATEDTVDLTPPIVVSKEKGYEKKEESSRKKRAKKTRKKRVSKEKKRGLINVIFGKKKKEPPKAEKIEKQQKVKKQPAYEPRVIAKKIQTDEDRYLIDKIVNETIREKDNASNRIEDLTSELKRMQDELYFSKGQRSELEEKINEILGKLDELKDALDDEIRRRQVLGEKVEGLIAKRDAYVRAKKAYEELEIKVSRISEKVDDLNLETNRVAKELDMIRFGKKKLEEDVYTMSTEYKQLKRDYKNTVKLKDSITLDIDRMTQELEELRYKLDKTIDEKSTVITELKDLENRTEYSNSELNKLKQLLSDKNELIMELAQRHNQLRIELDSFVSKKFKAEYSYRSAKTEFEKIKKEIESYLQEKR